MDLVKVKVEMTRMENLDSVVGLCVCLNFEMELRDGLLEQRFGQCDRFVCV